MILQNSKILKAALAYAKLGWRVVPLHTIKDGKCTCQKGVECDCPGKHPRIKGWPEEATTDIDKIKMWFCQWPQSNIGIATGAGSGIIVIDIDPRHGGEENLHDLQREHGRLPDTVEALTGGGGRHLIFKHPGGIVPNCVGKDECLAPGIDVRADGGLIVVSPSMHISGRRYEWEVSSRPDEMEPAELPEAWLKLIRGGSNKTNTQSALKVEESIPAGHRNDALFKIASSFRAKGLNTDEIYAAIWQVNINRCVPPLGEDEIKTIVDSASRYQAGPLVSNQKSYKLTDAGNAERIADMLCGKYLYVPEKDTWLKDNGKVWADDVKNELVQDVICCFRQAQKDALNIDDDDKRTKTLKWLLASESQTRINATISIMRTIPFMVASINQFDTDDMLLNVQNGIVDLRTGQLMEHRKEYRLTRICNVSYNPKAKSTLFEEFLDEITEGSNEKKRYLQKLCGYCCTGRILEEEFYQAKGSGQNGKTKLFETIKYCLGSYAVTASPDILMVKDMTTVPNDIARLHGARMILMSEPDPGKKFSDNAIKSLTGGDTVIARFLHREFFEFTMKGKLIMLTNHEIKAIGTDHGLWRRMVVIPFTYQVPEEKKDKHLQEKLIAEAEAVLAWMVQGCLMWQHEGLEQPDELKTAKAEYRQGQDAVGLFLEECCKEEPKAKVPAADLYKAYVQWCQVTGEYEISQRLFGSRLREKGFVSAKSGTVYWFGLCLLDNLDKLDKKPINYKNKILYRNLPEFCPNRPDRPDEKTWWDKNDQGEDDELPF